MMSYKKYINYSLKGIMMGSLIVGSFLQMDEKVAKAASGNLDANKNFNSNLDVKLAQVKVVKEVSPEESDMILNLKNANRLLEEALKTNQIEIRMFERITQALVAIETKIDNDGAIVKHQELLEIVIKTEITLGSEKIKNLPEEAASIKSSTDKVLATVKAFLRDLGEVSTTTVEEDDIDYVSTEETLAKGYEIVSSPDWEIGEHVPKNYTDPELKALKENGNYNIIHNKYNDFDANAYWAKDMKWAIDQGLITGYQNQKHPSQPAKGVGNWIDPGGSLTEYQMLNIMLRYKDGANFESAKATMKDKTASNFAYVEYHFANKHGITTKGSMTHAIPAKQQVTRGQMAQALVSMHYGKTVTLQQAVDFMYANGLTTGKDPSRGQTVANFDANGKLVRAHIVAFMGRYNELVIAGDIKDTLNNPADYTIVPTPPKGSNNNNSSVGTVNPSAPKFEHTKYDYSNLFGKFDTTKNFEFKDFGVYISGGTTVTTSTSSRETVVIDDVLGDKGERVKIYTGKVIKTSYKDHTYNVKSQAEYDQVMNHVRKLLEGKTYLYTKMYNPYYYNNDEEAFRQDEIFGLNILERLMDGSIEIVNDRTDPAFRTDENIKASGWNISYGDAIKQRVSFDTLAKFSAANWYVSFFTDLDDTTQGGIDLSAYDYFIKKESSSLSSAYAKQAIFDALGYNTAVVHSHSAYLIVELDGQWFEVGSGLKAFNKDSVLKSEFIKFAPTKHADKLDFIKIM